MKGLADKKKPLQFPEGARYKIWRRPTLPPVTAVPSALAGLTALFGMGRGRHRRYRHLNIVTGVILYIHNLLNRCMHPVCMTHRWNVTTYKGIDKKYNKWDSGSSGAESFGLLVPLGYGISTFTPVAYQRSNLLRPCKEA